MRIAIITQNEPIYLPKSLDQIVQARLKDIVSIIILKPFNKSLLNGAWRVYNLCGFWDFLVYIFKFVTIKVMSIFNRVLPLGGPWSIAGVARRYCIPVYRPKSINAPDFLSLLSQEIRPDIIVSVDASQVFKQDILHLPKYGCINIHSSPLPRYRGMLPAFWVLLHGEKETAVTVHYMTEKLDDGDIIHQETVPIAPEDTLDSLIRKVKRVGVKVLINVLEDIENGTVIRQPNDTSRATYFSFPTRDDAKRFRSQGWRIR